LNAPLTDSSISISPVVPGYYYVMVENPNCILIDSVFVDFTANSLTVPLALGLCLGDEGTITASGGNPADPFITFDWEADSIIVAGDGTSSITVNPSSTQYVYMTATSTAGCVVFDSVLVTVDNPPTGINAWVDVDTIAFGGSTMAHVLPAGFNYSWSPAADFTSPNTANSEVIPSILGNNQYIVTISNGNCTRSDTVDIFTFDVVCDESYIFIPNAFTPNADGNNDVLKVRTQALDDIYFTVYDRWGEQVFETQDPNIGWDGFFKGKKCDPDVYVYYLRGNCVGQEEPYFKKGNVTLIR
jgi:gliding motility-associated-like protein